MHNEDIWHPNSSSPCRSRGTQINILSNFIRYFHILLNSFDPWIFPIWSQNDLQTESLWFDLIQTVFNFCLPYLLFSLLHIKNAPQINIHFQKQRRPVTGWRKCIYAVVRCEANSWGCHTNENPDEWWMSDFIKFKCILYRDNNFVSDFTSIELIGWQHLLSYWK